MCFHQYIPLINKSCTIYNLTQKLAVAVFLAALVIDWYEIASVLQCSYLRATYTTFIDILFCLSDLVHDVHAILWSCCNNSVMLNVKSDAQLAEERRLRRKAEDDSKQLQAESIQLQRELMQERQIPKAVDQHYASALCLCTCPFG